MTKKFALFFLIFSVNFFKKHLRNLFQCFSISISFRRRKILTRLERQITGHIEHPRVQQQHKHPQNSHLTLIGKFFLKVTLTLVTVALNSSGATRACSPEGNSVSNRLDKPNL